MSQQAHDPDGHFDATPHVPRTRVVAGGAFVVVAGLVALVGVRALSGHGEAALAHGADASMPSVPRVQVAAAHALAAHPLVLPGRVDPLERTAVHTRVSGYVKRWLVDIGDHVAAGQTLAEIDTPELDQELLQARATVGQAEAQLGLAKSHRELARVTLARTSKLAAQGLVTQQELDDKQTALAAEQANVAAAEAAVTSAHANLARLEQLKGFARVAAPFAGTVTARTAERGALVQADSATTPALFEVAATEIVRVFVDVPQTEAPSIRPGQAATVTVRELSQRPFAGKVTRTARALDPTTRTLRTEVQVDNRDGTLLPGMYAQVGIAGAHDAGGVAVPSTAIATDARGTRVAVVREGRLEWRTVQVGEDLGREATVVAGLAVGERVVTNPSDALRDGAAVEVVEAAR